MTDILFGNNNRPVLKLLANRSLKAQKNTIAVLAIMLATLLFTSFFTIAISLQTAMQESNMRTIATKKINGFTVVTTLISSVSIFTIAGSNNRPIGHPDNSPIGIPIRDSLIAFL